MKYKSPGQYKSAESFRQQLRALVPDFDCVLEPRGANGPLGQPFVHRGRRLANRFCIQPMEGWDGTTSGLPSEATLRRWRHFGRSGAKLIWGGEAFAVREDGRANPHQLYLNPSEDGERGLQELRSEVRAGHRGNGEDPDELLLGLQLTHSGRFARPEGKPAPLVAFRHPVLERKFPASGMAKVLSDGELEEIAERFVDVAQIAQSAGFDFVDVKCAHGYLLHELLGAHTRKGPYGGSFEGRTALFRRIVEGIRSACKGLEIGARVSLCDLFPFFPGPDRIGEPRGWEDELPYRYGFGLDPADPRQFDLAEPFRFLGLLQAMDITLVNVTLGSPYYCPHLQRPAAYPPSDGYLPPEDPLLSVYRHLSVLRRCKAAFPQLVFVGTGYSYLQEYLPHVAEVELEAGHVDFVGIGRMVLSYPEFPRDCLGSAGLQRKLICRTFSDCTTAPRMGLPSGCYPLDGDYKSSPDAAKLKALKDEMR